MDYPLILAVLRALKHEGVEFKVFGGVAVNLHGLARATEDLDIFIAPTPLNVDRLRAALNRVFADPEIASITAEDLLGAYPAIQYVPPQNDFHIDILTRLGEAFSYEDVEVEELDVEGTLVPVATPRMLYRMKRSTVRYKDRLDAERLRAEFDLKEDV